MDDNSVTAGFVGDDMTKGFIEAGQKHRQTVGSNGLPLATVENPPKNFKDYIIKEEPTDEIGIISINGVNVLSMGNALLITGPLKSRKTMLASILVNQCKLKTAYIDTEQGRHHSWRTGKFTPWADVFHLRGVAPEEIKRVINCCVECGEYQLIVLDNGRDLIPDFNDVKDSHAAERYLGKISESLPVIVILHENKTSPRGQGHQAHGFGKVAQTTIRVHLVDEHDPAQGSFVDCVHSRDEPFQRAFISKDGVLTSNNIIKTGKKSMSIEEVFRIIGEEELTRDALLEKIASIYGIEVNSARNTLAALRKAWPNAFKERKLGKTKVFQCCIDFKMHQNAAMH